MSAIFCLSYGRFKWGFITLKIEIQNITDSITRLQVRKQVSCTRAYNFYVSHDMTKPTKCVRAQRRLRSAWASIQSDQSIR